MIYCSTESWLFYPPPICLPVTLFMDPSSSRNCSWSDGFPSVVSVCSSRAICWCQSWSPAGSIHDLISFLHVRTIYRWKSRICSCLPPWSRLTPFRITSIAPYSCRSSTGASTAPCHQSVESMAVIASGSSTMSYKTFPYLIRSEHPAPRLFPLQPLIFWWRATCHL